MKTFARWLLSFAMVSAGSSHLLWARQGFQAQVPDWTTKVTGLDKDAVVLASGGAEILLGASLVAGPKHRRRIGTILAAFFVAVFPGNLEQYLKKRDGLNLDSDQKRLLRLFFQPLLVVWALWATSPTPSGR